MDKPPADAQRCVSCGGIVKMADCPICMAECGPSHPNMAFDGRCHACSYVQPQEHIDGS